MQTLPNHILRAKGYLYSYFVLITLYHRLEKCITIFVYVIRKEIFIQVLSILLKSTGIYKKKLWKLLYLLEYIYIRFVRHKLRNLAHLSEHFDGRNVCPACPKVWYLVWASILGVDNWQSVIYYIIGNWVKLARHSTLIFNWEPIFVYLYVGLYVCHLCVDPPIFVLARCSTLYQIISFIKYYPY